MAELCSLQSRLANVIRILFLLLLSFVALQAQPSNQANDPSTRSSIEQRTSRYFESIRKSPPQELAFLLKMPKDGDLHNHLSGAIYAESYIQWAADNGLCVNTTTMALSAPAPPKAATIISSTPSVSLDRLAGIRMERCLPKPSRAPLADVCFTWN